MVGFLRHGRDEQSHPLVPTAPDAGPDDDDSPNALRQRLWQLVQFINHNAGSLPVDGVVIAREITDTIRMVIETSDEHELDIYAVVSINGIVGDYLPTTLRTYLNLDPAVTEQAGPSGRTPHAALREQLESLAGAADELLQAARQRDVNALLTQGSFLRTKFTRSDLDL